MRGEERGRRASHRAIHPIEHRHKVTRTGAARPEGSAFDAHRAPSRRPHQPLTPREKRKAQFRLRMKPQANKDSREPPRAATQRLTQHNRTAPALTNL